MAEPQGKRMRSDTNQYDFPMDELLARFPHIARQIFQKLDRKTLGSCRTVSKAWKDCFDDTRHWWTLQLLQCSNLILYKFGNVTLTLMDEFSDLVSIIEDHICVNETLENVKLFAKFMINFHLNHQNFSCKLYNPFTYASQNNR